MIEQAQNLYSFKMDDSCYTLTKTLLVFSYGQDFPADTEEELLKLLQPEHIAGLTLLGGEPFEPSSPELCPDIPAGPAGDIHLIFILIPAIGAFPYQLGMSVSDDL